MELEQYKSNYYQRRYPRRRLDRLNPLKKSTEHQKSWSKDNNHIEEEEEMHQFYSIKLTFFDW